MIIATAGHVDHGKTALVRALTGVDTDRLPQEKARGISIELGFAFRAAGACGTVGFIDVPGHERLVHTMVGGVSGIHHALLVVAADDGPMPQTREHLAILELLGLSSATLVITKIDRADAMRVAQVESDMQALLVAGPIGPVPAFRVCAPAGEGIGALWDHLAALSAAERRDASELAGGFRLAIDRCFTMDGVGCVVTGTVHAGTVRVGDRLAIAPGGEPVRVRGLRVQGLEAREAGVGVRCALNVGGAQLEASRIRRGDWVVTPEIAVGTDRIDARLRLLGGQPPLRSGSRVHVHLAAKACTGRIVMLQGRADASAPCGADGGESFVQLVLDEPIGARWGDRFVLRDWSARHTLGGGSVLDPAPAARGRGRVQRLAVLRAQQQGDVAAAFRGLLEVETDGVDVEAFLAARNVPREARDRVTAAVDHVPVVHRGRTRAFGRARWDELSRRILAVVQDWHESRPAAWGPAEPSLREALGIDHPPAALDACVQRLIDRGELSRVKVFLRRPGHVPMLEPRDRPLWRTLGALLEAQTPCPSSVLKLAAAAGVPEPQVEGLLQRAGRLGLVVGLANRRYLLQESLDALTQVVRQVAAASPDGSFTVADYRDSAGIGRKFCVDVLEHFDRCGLTRRLGERRWLVGRREAPAPSPRPADERVLSDMH